MKKLSAFRLLHVMLVTVLSVSIITCQHEDPPPPPVALFTYYPNTNLVAPVTLSFTNKSTNAESYLWEFGGGQPETGKDVVLIATVGGTYTVSLMAKGKGGSDTYSRTITITNPVVVAKTTAGFTYSPSQSLTAPAKITFTNTSKEATSYKWDFGDGTTATDASPTKEFTKAGTFKVKLTATGKNNTDEYSADIMVNGPATVPTADFTYSPSSNLTAPVKITFTNASKNASSYKWDFGDGTGSADANPIKEFTKAGDYTVKLTATDSKNQTAQKSAVVSVKAAPVAVTPVADWSWSASNLKVTFKNASKNANSYSWNFNDGTAASTATNPVHDYAKAGVYTVTLTASDGKTQHQQSGLVTVSAPVAASCDWAGWAKLLKVTKWAYKAGDAYCKVNKGYDGASNLEVQNLSATGMDIYFSLQTPTGVWENQGFQSTGSGGTAKTYICGNSPGYFIQARPFGVNATTCPFSKK